jgi:hypothetical protein
VDADTAALAVGAEGSPSADDPPGWVLGGRYRVRSRIGTGGMAEVFRATDALLGRDVAVKVFRSVGATEDAGGAERQEIELQALAKLSHPHLITLFDASVTDTPPYLVMELVEGPSLAARIAEGPLPEPEVRAIGSQIADALSYVHAHGMVHRDVKPANILLGSDALSWDGSGRARLSDFGIVRLLGSERLTAADFTLGTASYLAPEKARGGDVTPAADVYSLGLVLIEALTGTRSFDGPPVEAVLARLARDPEIPANLPAPWPQLLAAMTARDPDTRPAPADVCRALRTGTTVVPPAAPITAGVAAPAAAAGVAAFAPSTGPAAWVAPDSTPTALPAVAPAGAVAGAAAGAVAGAAAGAATVPPVEPDVLDDERRRGGWFALAALFVLAIVGAGCFLVFGSSPNGGTDTPAGSSPTTSHHATTKPHTSAVHAVVPPQDKTVPSTSAVVSHAAQTTTAPPAQQQSSAPATSAAPTTSAPAPTTSAPPQTNSAPSTSAGAAVASTQAIVAPAPPPAGGDG